MDYACKINADGSASIKAPGPEDHARAMEALAAMSNAVPAFLRREMSTPPPAPSRPRAIGKAADSWLKSIEADTLKKTLIIKAAAINGFAQHVGVKKMLREVQREDVHAWVEALRTSGLQTPMVAKNLRQWLKPVGSKTLYIEPGSPWENGCCESFNGKFRDELLNGEIFYTRREAQVVIEQWRQHYNTVRPHSALNYRPPASEALLPAIQDVHLRLAA